MSDEEAKFNKLLDETLKNYIDNNSDVCFEFSGGLDSTSLLLSSLKLKRKYLDLSILFSKSLFILFFISIHNNSNSNVIPFDK